MALIVPFILFGFVSTAHAAWYDPDWSKRQPITVDNTGNSNTLTNYQVQVDVTYDSDMQADFDDIRFTNSSGTELDYWIESKTDGTSATIWVEVDSIAASSNTTIYMYYGNGSVTNTSHAKNTMFIYEDMESAPSGTLKDNAFYDSTDKWVRLTTATNSTYGELEYASSPSPGFVAEWKFWAGGGSSPGADATYLYAQAPSTPDREDDGVNGYFFAADEWDDELQVNFNGSTLSSTAQTGIDSSSWHDVRVVFYQSGSDYYYQLWYDETQEINTSSTNVPTGDLFGWGARTGGYNNEHRIDDLVVRKYTSPEPSVSLGSEQTYAKNVTQIRYRWRNDDGPEGGGLDTGTGADDNDMVTILSSKNINTDILGSNRSNPDGVVTTVSSFGSATGGTTLTVASATGFGADDEVFLTNLQGDSTNNGNAGNYEFLEIQSIEGTTFTFKTGIQNIYGATTSTLVLTGQKVVVQRVPQWKAVTIADGGTLTANDWAGSSGGIIVFRATGTVEVQSNGSISANSLGYRGGAGGTTGGGGGKPRLPRETRM